MEPLRLFQFPLSPYCEKVRWVLDFKELPYVANNLVPGMHMAMAQVRTNQSSLPVLEDRHSYISDSSQIAIYLDDIYPEHRIISPYPDLHQQILDWNSKINPLGEDVKRWVLSNMLDFNTITDISLFNRGFGSSIRPLARPVLLRTFKVYYRLDRNKRQQLVQKIKQQIQYVEQQLSDHRTFLVGNHLSLADISVASMIAPLLHLPETPWECLQTISFQPEYYDYYDELQDSRVAHYVRHLYQHHRNALVDWRGC